MRLNRPHLKLSHWSMTPPPSKAVEPKTVDTPAVSNAAIPTTTTMVDVVQVPAMQTCRGEVVSVQYPTDWFSNMDLDDENHIDCLWFRNDPIDGHLDHPVKIERLRDISLSEAVTVLTANESAAVLSETIDGAPDDTVFGISQGGERVRLELANINVPETASRAIHLIEVGGSVYQITADQDWAFEVADNMAATIEFVIQ